VLFAYDACSLTFCRCFVGGINARRSTRAEWQLLLTYEPHVGAAFGTGPHPWWVWLRAIGCGLFVFLFVEAEKVCSLVFVLLLLVFRAVMRCLGVDARARGRGRTALIVRVEP